MNIVCCFIGWYLEQQRIVVIESREKLFVGHIKVLTLIHVYAAKLPLFDDFVGALSV